MLMGLGVTLGLLLLTAGFVLLAVFLRPTGDLMPFDIYCDIHK